MLIGKEQTDYFSCTRIDVTEEVLLRQTGALFKLGIVVAGSGKLLYNGGELSLKKGEEIFLPAGVTDARLVAEEPLSLMLSHPPGAKHEL